MSVPADRPSQQVTIDRDACTFRLTRDFDHPPELVFKAWTSCEHLRRWWGPRDFTLPFCEMDFRPGGRWRYGMHHPDYGTSYGMATYEEIDPPRRIVYRDAFTDEDGTVNEALPQTRVELDFVDLGGRTRLVNVGHYRSAEALQQVLDMQMEEGFSMTLDRLDDLLADLDR